MIVFIITCYNYCYYHYYCYCYYYYYSLPFGSQGGVSQIVLSKVILTGIPMFTSGVDFHHELKEESLWMVG